MNEAITPTKTISYHLEATAFEAELNTFNSGQTFLKQVEDLVNKALIECVNAGKAPLRFSLHQPGDYLRLVVSGVDVDAPQLIKQVFLDGGKSDAINQEV